MTTFAPLRTLSLMLLLAVLTSLPQTWADDLESIRFGEAALNYASGSIQRATPQDGVVNVITGDNQTSGDRMQLGQGDTLYLKLKNPADVAVGDVYTVFKRARKVFHPMTREYLGYLVVRLAIVQVVQVDKSLTTVQTLRSYGAISPGDPVVKFALPAEPETLPDQGTSPDSAGMVVELQADMGLTLVAQRNVVYIDRGREDGIRSGDQFDVIRSGGNLPPRQVGQVRILSAEGRTATALVTKSTSRILKGDRIRVSARAPEALPISQPVSQDLPKAATPFAEANAGGDKVASLPVQQAARETKITLNDLMKQLRFESGEATIKPEGYRVLDELVEYVKHAPMDQLIRVEGHADNMEIGPSLKSYFPTNWDLSKARATGVLRYLVEKGGIDSARISSVGYGDTKPVVSNATETGRQKNRRVDIVLYTPESESNTDRMGNQAAVRSNAREGSGHSSMPQVSATSGDVHPSADSPTVPSSVDVMVPSADQSSDSPVDQVSQP